MTSNTLRITEIFHSLQGESRTMGLPTVFVRLTGCPLRCQYCDTAYAFEGGQVTPVDDILQESVIAVWQNVNKSEFLLQSKLSTYVMAIAKNLWFKELKKKKQI